MSLSKLETKFMLKSELLPSTTTGVLRIFQGIVLLEFLSVLSSENALGIVVIANPVKIANVFKIPS